MKTLTFVVCLVLTGCTTQPSQFVGGSKADGIVVLQHRGHIFSDVPEKNRKIEDDKATEFCRGWGYEKALRFDGKIKECLEPNPTGFGYGVGTNGWGPGCATYRYTYHYQCLDADE